MISTEMTLKDNNVYWLTNNDMISLQLVTKCIGVLSIADNSKNINQN